MLSMSNLIDRQRHQNRQHPRPVTDGSGVGPMKEPVSSSYTGGCSPDDSDGSDDKPSVSSDGASSRLSRMQRVPFLSVRLGNATATPTWRRLGMSRSSTGFSLLGALGHPFPR